MKHWKTSEYIDVIVQNRETIQRAFFALAVVSLLINFYFGIAISQIGPNPLLYQEMDPVYWLFMKLRLPGFISGNFAPLFDGLLLLFCILSIVWTRNSLFPLLFFLLHLLFFLTYNMLSGHHYISIGLLIMSFPFIFINKSRFTAAFILCRFIFCFMMFSAACWKIIRGNVMYTDQAHMLLLDTHIEMLLSNRVSIMTDIIKWLLAHKPISHLLWLALILIEGTFVIGFFTLKWDKLLTIFYLLFFAGGWLFFNIYNYDNLLFLITLAPALNFLKQPKQLLNSNNGSPH